VSPAAQSAGAATLLADGCSFQGKAQVAGTLRIEGVAEGEISATDSVVIGKSGKVDADVSTRRAVLNGRFRGKIDAEDCVEMQSGSNVEAEVHAKNMVMEDGVQFEGNCKIGK
jgi:cytoskeletal protein CcmA (bactofilin family)